VVPHEVVDVLPERLEVEGEWILALFVACSGRRNNDVADDVAADVELVCGRLLRCPAASSEQNKSALDRVRFMTPSTQMPAGRLMNRGRPRYWCGAGANVADTRAAPNE